MATTVMKRQTAYRTWISNLVQCKYVKQEGWDPNYVELNGKQASRIYLMGTVVSKYLSEDGNYGAITLDDGSDTIRCKAFGPDVANISGVEVGAIVRVVGKVKEYNDEIHLSPELVKEVEDPNWLLVWKLEQGKALPSKPQTEVIRSTPTPVEKIDEKPVETEKVGENPETTKVEEPDTEVIDSQEENFTAKILGIIKKLDTGDGAKIEDIMKDSGLDDDEVKNLVIGLLKSGDIFEPRKGLLKPL